MNPLTLMRKPNRPVPMERIPRRAENNVEQHDDGRVSIHHMTMSELLRLRELAERDVHLFGLCWAIDDVLGLHDDDDERMEA